MNILKSLIDGKHREGRRKFIRQIVLSSFALTSSRALMSCTKGGSEEGETFIPEPTPVETDPQVSISNGLFNQSKKDDLGLRYLDGTEQITVFRPDQPLDMKFNNHPQLVEFRGKLYATWVGHPLHETSEISYVYYSYSSNGTTWEKPIQVGPANRASGGWLTDGNQLHCLLIAGDKANKTSITEYCSSTDGIAWTEPKVLIRNAAPSESARRLPNGRYIMICHGLGTGVFKEVRGTRSMYSDSKDGLSDWKQALLPDLPDYNVNSNEKVARAVEASFFGRLEGELIMLFRDLYFDAAPRTWKLLAAVSQDNGATWSKPTLTNIPDSDSMQCAGNLSGSVSYFVNNPVPTRRRVPLTVTLSKNGKLFNKSFLLRDVPQPRRYDGISKTEGYSYPGSFVWKGYLYVAYATNKEDVEITRIAVDKLIAQV